MIDLLLVNKSIIPRKRKSTPRDATKEDNRKITINAPTKPPIAVPVIKPARIQSAGSMPDLAIIAKTYAATA